LKLAHSAFYLNNNAEPGTKTDANMTTTQPLPRVIPHSIGCVASPSVPAETVIANGWSAFLLLLAVSEVVDPATGYLDEVSIAILEFTEFVDLRFGYPNDEGLPEHPPYE
jgi:hypothetical protein